VIYVYRCGLCGLVAASPYKATFGRIKCLYDMRYMRFEFAAQSATQLTQVVYNPHVNAPELAKELSGA
jgi:hypothetical protein